MRVSQDQRAPGQHLVDVPVAILVPEISVLSPGDKGRFATHSPKGPHGAVYAAGDDLLGSGQQFGDRFRKLNPDCTVPVLELDDGHCISEVIAICSYLEELYPQPPLFGKTPRERATALMWNARIEQQGFGLVLAMMRAQEPVPGLELCKQGIVAGVTGGSLGPFAGLELHFHLAIAKFDAERGGERRTVATPCLGLGLEPVVDMYRDYRDISTGECMREHR